MPPRESARRHMKAQQAMRTMSCQNAKANQGAVTACHIFERLGQDVEEAKVILQLKSPEQSSQLQLASDRASEGV